MNRIQIDLVLILSNLIFLILRETVGDQLPVWSLNKYVFWFMPRILGGYTNNSFSLVPLIIVTYKIIEKCKCVS